MGRKGRELREARGEDRRPARPVGEESGGVRRRWGERPSWWRELGRARKEGGEVGEGE
jgi:hypothetical protein